MTASAALSPPIVGEALEGALRTAKVEDVNLSETKRFLNWLADEGAVTFQTFKKDSRLNRIFHGTLAQHEAQLERLNHAGAAVCVMVNEGDLRGRGSKNVRRVRALFVDLDGSPLDPVLAAPLPPHIIVESSPGRFHAYWKVDDCPVALFGQLQRALAERFHGDLAVVDLPRVMRLPGFIHRKGPPFRTRVHGVNDRPRYTFNDVISALALKLNRSGANMPVVPERGPIVEGQRHTRLMSFAGMLRRQGRMREDIDARLAEMNVRHCTPPLPDDEVREIASAVMNMEPAGYIKVPYSVHDRLRREGLGPSEHYLLMHLLRLHNGSNNGQLTATVREVKAPGLESQRSVSNAINKLVQHAFVMRTFKARPGRAGQVAQAARYALAWLPPVSNASAHTPVPQNISDTVPEENNHLVVGSGMLERGGAWRGCATKNRSHADSSVAEEEF